MCLSTSGNYTQLSRTGASVINVYIRVVMPANGLRVNHYDLSLRVNHYEPFAIPP